MSTSTVGPFATPEDVRKHLHAEDWDTKGLDDLQLQYFIDERANLIIEEDLADTGQSERRLAVIEALLAGHYILASGIDELRQGARDGASDGAYTWYAGEYGMGLLSTSLGQQAVEMDRSGILRDMAEGSEDSGRDYEPWTVAVPSSRK